MRLHILTVGEPKLAYARAGWQEYIQRLSRYHHVRTTHLADKWAYDSEHILRACGNAYKVGLVIEGKQLSSPELASFLEKRALEGRELCFVVGGPEGLPQSTQDGMDRLWSFSKLTFPHDLAMVVLAEALYRAASISSGHPYHKA